MPNYNTKTIRKNNKHLENKLYGKNPLVILPRNL
jgi:hypothetical protein